ncbi:hypothetical protein ACTXG6_16040 [Pseudonocardia sp. Cha107L01]|uniref:hypothetical protein n=1 Tax=Pseudonocardia sp. Cha107L01 TaxID=3457576 RepID=UPI00403E3C50
MGVGVEHGGDAEGIDRAHRVHVGAGGDVDSVAGRVRGERIGHLDPAVFEADRVEVMQRCQYFVTGTPGARGGGRQVRGCWWVPGRGEVAQDQLVYRRLDRVRRHRSRPPRAEQVTGLVGRRVGGGGDGVAQLS